MMLVKPEVCVNNTVVSVIILLLFWVFVFVGCVLRIQRYNKYFNLLL